MYTCFPCIAVGLGFTERTASDFEGDDLGLTVQILSGQFDTDVTFTVQVVTRELIDQPNVATGILYFV